MHTSQPVSPSHTAQRATRLTTDVSSKVTSTQIKKARDSKSLQNPHQWSHTLLSTLLQRRSAPEETPDSVPAGEEKIELVASIASSNLNLIIRKNISGITQRLGELSLPHDDDEELDVLHWTSVAVERATALDQEVSTLTSSYKSAEQSIASLTKQLEELITAKQAHETALLGKFKELLNQKKLKIRDQQRLLACTTINRQRAEKIRAAGWRGTAEAKARTPRVSGKGKRKADDAKLGKGGGNDDDDDDGDGEDAFEKPSSVGMKEEDGDDDEDMDEGVETPDAEEEDVTEDEEGGGLGLGQGEGTGEGEESGAHGERMQLDTSPSAMRDLPPDRELPFGKDASKPTMLAQPEAGNEGEETDDDDDDDEL